MKKLIPLSELLKDRYFYLPPSVGVDYNAEGKRGVSGGVNGKKYFVPVGVNTPIPHDVFCNLRDAGVIMKEAVGYEEFDPFTYERN